uniref:Ground-like domain-containing protein n=1 Tax=Elaeophora elaphi TaxID=1147741 RepID=A0A0R3RNU0_9BILA
MDDNPITSKELIQKATKAQFNEDFNVVCSTDTFAYVTYTDKYCEVNNELVICYAFKTE